MFARGKIHKLYGSLTDIRTMVIECFAAMQSLRGLPVGTATPHEVEDPAEVPAAIKAKVAYDVESTMQLLAIDWTSRQEELLVPFPDRDSRRNGGCPRLSPFLLHG